LSDADFEFIGPPRVTTCNVDVRRGCPFQHDREYRGCPQDGVLAAFPVIRPFEIGLGKCQITAK
jgi:hypothetical protein